MKLYVLRNNLGQYFRPEGDCGTINYNWVSDLDRAKFYTSPSGPKGQATFYAQHHPEIQCDMLVFTLRADAAEVVSLKEHITQSKAKRDKALANRKARSAALMLLQAQRRLQEAQRDVNRLKT